MSQQDYYSTLGVSPSASIEDIKRAYRKLALETHPDRNPGDARAEERFKNISEAYGVLIDPQKRAQYDDFRRFGFHSQPGTGRTSPSGFGYTQEEIFRDFFNSRHAHEVFSEMQREFQRMGMRFDDTFLNRLFFGDKTIFFQGIFWGGPGGSTRVFRYGGNTGQRSKTGNGSSKAVENQPRGLLESGVSLLARAGKKVGSFVLGKLLGDNHGTKHIPGTSRSREVNSDVMYELPISAVESIAGATVELELPHWENGKRVSVRIPAGVRSGTRLRLKGMGQPQGNNGGRRGDLYIQLRVQ